MKSRLTPLVAALLLAGAAPFAYSQAAAPAPAQAAAAAPADVAAPAAYVDAPVASVSRSDDLANAIAQALIADASLKDSKITVQPDADGTIVLTGVTPTNAQRQKALEIATTHAGSGKVTNALTSGELVIATTPPVTAAATTASEETVAVASDFVAAPEPAPAAESAQPAQAGPSTQPAQATASQPAPAPQAAPATN